MWEGALSLFLDHMESSVDCNLPSAAVNHVSLGPGGGKVMEGCPINPDLLSATNIFPSHQMCMIHVVQGDKARIVL